MKMLFNVLFTYNYHQMSNLVRVTLLVFSDR